MRRLILARPIKKPLEQWKSEIKNASRLLFAEQGYEETTVSDLMQKVGGAKGIFYRCDESKEDVLFDLINEYLERFNTAMADGNESFYEKIHHLVYIISDMVLHTNGFGSFQK